MTYLDSLHKNNLDKLEPEENKIFEDFLQKFPDRNEIKNKESKEDNSKTIDNIKFYNIFQKVFDIYGIENKLVIIDNTKTEVIEDNNILYVP
jgi:hypothetical protein